ncbi:hypothetical protein [Mesonia mobilis]|uniref:hypothetical protein n=1 Tax=Mesonia mobilis TaxID=369791 RepID=UPI0024B9ABBA|nr:hypothetical protein [Mesonia mobilis]
MIVFQTKLFQLDLSAYGVSLKEENSLFTDNIHQSYSLPFSAKLDDELKEKLDLVTLDNVIDKQVKIEGRLLLQNRHFEAVLYVEEYENTVVEFNLRYGSDILPIYETPLKDLGWPTIITQNLTQLAKTTISQAWPQTGFNFPMVYHPELPDGNDYDRYLGFVNNYEGGNFLTNEVIQEENDDGDLEDVYVNRNVMAPFPYLLEILKFGFSQAGKQAIGEIFTHPDFKKALYIPGNYLERFDASENQQISFNQRTSAQSIGGLLYNIYETSFTPTTVGSYNVNLNVNMPPGIAELFFLQVIRQDALSQDETVIRSYASNDTRVQIEEKITVNVENGDNYDPIIIRMRLRYQQTDISSYNNFEFSFSGGQLNVFPNVFSLADFMPDMKFGEFVNELKNWLNLDIKHQDRLVKIDFVENTLFNKPRKDHEHLQIPNPRWKSNRTRFYKLTYKNDETVYYGIDGQVYSELEQGKSETITIDMDLQPALVESNKNIITAVAPEDAAKIDFCLFDGLSGLRPTCKPEIANLLSLQNVKDNFWSQWLYFRVHSKTLKEVFECSVFEEIFTDEYSKKYNELHIFRKLDKKFISETRMKVDIESETF